MEEGLRFRGSGEGSFRGEGDLAPTRGKAGIEAGVTWEEAGVPDMNNSCRRLGAPRRRSWPAGVTTRQGSLGRLRAFRSEAWVRARMERLQVELLVLDKEEPGKGANGGGTKEAAESLGRERGDDDGAPLLLVLLRRGELAAGTRWRRVGRDALAAALGGG
ncbi:hypothetical protein TRIUR3_35280 [Triticum urartu]|uniref:Uncharacterized protein n=1 Tax=Triticum urartu TaxID=4572 RepID=M7ZCX7_TRIUA|nr:hypothetical protein TRIUR3_35280 [Triticum urartu]